MREASTFTDTLGELWRLRLARDIPACVLQLPRLQSHLNDGLSGQSRVQAYELLRASLCRAQGDLAQATAKLSQLPDALEQSRWQPYLHYERAFADYNVGNYDRAMHQFSMGHNQALHFDDFNLASACLTNIIFCFDQLGIDGESTAEILRTYIGRIDIAALKVLVDRQLENFSLRQQFRRGQLGPAENIDQADQTSLYQAWLQALPYHPGYSGIPHLKWSAFSAAQHSGLPGFRVRTLLGQVHPDDELVLNPFELADRFYLWTWRWLVDPAESSLERIAMLLNKLVGKLAQLTKEDLALTRNAVNWLRFFFPDQDLHLSKLLGKLSATVQNRMPFLDFECLSIEYFMAQRCKDHERMSQLTLQLKELESVLPVQHPLQSLSVLMFKSSVVPDDFPGALKGLLDDISQLINNNAHTGAQVMADLSSFEVRSLADSKVWRSEALCRACELFSRVESCSFSELLQHCFALGNYRSDVHDKKIFNLLQRLKQVLGNNFQISSKQQRIFCNGPRQLLLIFGRSLIHRGPWPCSSLQEVSSREQKMTVDRAETFVPLLRNKPQFTRRDFEQHFQLSPSTSKRMLKRAVTCGLLHAQPDGKKIFYSMAKH